MHPFEYARAGDAAGAVAALAGDPEAAFIAGGTELVNWLKDGIERPGRVVDINRLPLGQIEATSAGLRIGTLARMSDVAAHRAVRSGFPALAEALERSASAQLRNMASMGGNLLQRTRCPYFRAETDLPCNKRRPGSGCAAREGLNRTHAIFGWSDACVATHPSDAAVALRALEASVRVLGRGGERSIPLADFYRLPGDAPERDTVLEHGELIVGIDVPATPRARRSWYVKVRERASYEFALVSAAVALDLDGGRIREVRIALGGVAPMPWPLTEAERALAGLPLERAALARAVDGAFSEARPLARNAFKIALAKRTVVRALEIAGGMA
ncbi:xanthine dehydrogenase family protein subunit M [bacterium]|nr:MAG: xanthine dehydrogenase family protein subunit M [bacterium]